MKKKSIWKHNKIKGEWDSSYQWTKKDRVFTLKNQKTGRVRSFEGWQEAVKQGWLKC